MKTYRVLKYFTDKEDHDFPYNEGDTYPREGLNVDDGRILELSTSANARGEKLIEEVKSKYKADEAED